MVVSCHETLVRVMHRENIITLTDKNCTFAFELDEGIGNKNNLLL